VSVYAEILMLALCLLAGAFFAGIETGLVAFNRLRLRHLVLRGDRNARRIEPFIREPERLLGTTLIGTNLSYVTASVFAARIGGRVAGERGAEAAGVLLIALILIGCEYIPKAWFQGFPARRVLPLAPLLCVFETLFTPARWLLTRSLGLLLPRRAPGAPIRSWLTREDLLHLADEGRAGGLLTASEIRMIRGVFSLNGKSCGEIMVPKNRMVEVEEDLSTADFLTLARQSGYSRFPVRRRGGNGYLGIVHVLDVLRDRHRDQWTVGHYVRPPQLVSARMLVDHILPRMRVTRQPMVLVVDDRFEVVGLITLSDVVAEIVGES